VAAGYGPYFVTRTRHTIERGTGETVRDAVRVTAHSLRRSSSDDIGSLRDATGDADILANNTGAVPDGDLRMIDEAHWGSA